MASNQTQCEMCCNENAVGYCKTCGNIGETCVEIHKTGRAFKIHILNMYEKDGCNPRSILCDIIQAMCTHHPTERTALFCKTHETLICGRCLQSDHVSSCGGYDVDMCKDATHINCDPANDTTEALYIIRDIAGDIKQMKEEIDQRIETNNTNVVKGNKELDSLEIKLKGKIKDSKRGFSQEICTTNDFNLDANSLGSASQEMQMTRNELIEAFIKAKLDAEKAEIARKRLEKESLQAKQSLEKTEKTRKELCDELKHVKHDLETPEKTRNTYNKELLQSKNFIEQCEMTREQQSDKLKQELDISEKRRKTFEKELLQAKVVIEQSEKTRQKLCDELERVKKDLDNSEKTRKQQCDELKQELYTSEKKRNTFDKDLLQAKLVLEQYEKTMQKQCDELEQQKQDLDHSEKTRKSLCDELTQVKQDLDRSEKERAVVQAQFLQAKESFNWTQPTGTLEVKASTEAWLLVKRPNIWLVFTFPDGIQTIELL
ncbi:uveal autoantigen with coiled-coil domains and ankyrin repeats protein-like isoform X6 [Mya arenaria]|uniref:uveal autoantigen with coiled-coil domains and ankyrin repeats protein-like isoform X6 n=1 Tax=Mya arenaria TaxID=6604 RepID=UPI0022E7D424|nr:uveal autoantigen with coiled-coil domains and ankyrin repeats protein-like isoform X6 [Mya arenaria]